MRSRYTEMKRANEKRKARRNAGPSAFWGLPRGPAMRDLWAGAEGRLGVGAGGLPAQEPSRAAVSLECPGVLVAPSQALRRDAGNPPAKARPVRSLARLPACNRRRRTEETRPPFGSHSKLRPRPKRKPLCWPSARAAHQALVSERSVVGDIRGEPHLKRHPPRAGLGKAGPRVGAP